jgi:RNA polymerase sigma-70 factor (ECF subfamily)
MEELVQLAKDGDKKAFTKLILDMKNELYGVAKSRLKNEDDIDDAIQNTMILAFHHLNMLRENKYFKTWVVKILINECNHIYQKKKFKDILNFSKEKKEELLKMYVEDNFSFNILIESLSYKEKIILKLYYKYEYTSKEIALILNKNENTIKTIIRRARETLKNNYNKEK